MLIVKTPYRFSLYGGGLDYPDWYNNNNTKVLCAGLDYYCYQTVRRLPPFFLHKHRAAYSKIELVNDFSEFEHPAIREILKHFQYESGIEISHVGDLPARSGIGSSSAFSVGLILALHALKGQYISRTDLALQAIKLEQGSMGEDVGFQDQCASAFGGLVLIETENGQIIPRKFITSSDYLKYFEDSILLGYDGTPRYSGNTSKITKASIRDDSNSPFLNELTDICNDGITQFSKMADISKHAQLTKLSRDIKLRLSNKLSDSYTQDLITTTEKAGSLCTRVMGAGGGGFFVCMAPSYKHSSIKSSLPSIKIWANLRISSSGSQVIYFD